MHLLDSRRRASDIQDSAMRFADEFMERGRTVAVRGRKAFNQLRSNRSDPLDEIKLVASFAVGAVTLIGVGYLVSRIVKSRRASASGGTRQTRHSNPRADRALDSSSSRRDESTHELLARLDTPEAIQRHNDLVRQMHANADAPAPRAGEHRPQHSAS